MTRNSGGPSIGQGGASKLAQDERDSDPDGIAGERGEEPSPEKSERGERPSSDMGGAIDVDSAHDRAS